MSTTLRRIIDLGSGGTARPGSPGDLRFHDNRTFFAETQTSWVRLWADWPLLQPDPSHPPDDPDGAGAPFLAVIDDQIAAANADGIKVLLQLYRFPLWANGLERLGAERNTDAEISYAYPDRIAPAAWASYVAAGRDPARVNPSRRALEFGLPPDGLGPDSAWAAFFAFCHDRWRLGRRGSGPYVHGFELVNEPNFQWWPQRAPAAGDDPFALADLTAHVPMAQMMSSAAAIAAQHPDGTLLFAPSFADSELGGRTVTQYDEFTAKLLDRSTPPATWPARRRCGRITTTPTSSAARRTPSSSACARSWPAAGPASPRARRRPCSSPRAACGCRRWPPTTRPRTASRPRR
jgi:hypothetical protein